MEKQFAVVVRRKALKQQGRILVRTYGPYTKNKAQSVAYGLRSQAVRRGSDWQFEISICTLNPDAPFGEELTQ